MAWLKHFKRTGIIFHRYLYRDGYFVHIHASLELLCGKQLGDSHGV